VFKRTGQTESSANVTATVVLKRIAEILQVHRSSAKARSNATKV
jgi:hypothetical protein